MYFDDLIIIAHEQYIQEATQVVLDLFRRWNIPRQDKKFGEDNPNGDKGSSKLTILGLLYDLANLTIAISPERISEIMAEMRSFLKGKEAKRLKEWESTRQLSKESAEAWQSVVKRITENMASDQIPIKRRKRE